MTLRFTRRMAVWNLALWLDGWEWNMSSWRLLPADFMSVYTYVLFECLIVVVSTHVRSRDVVLGL